MEYGVYLSTKFKPKEKQTGIIVIEPDDYTDEEIKAIKTIKLKDGKLLAYLSIGTLEKERAWYKKYSKYKFKKLEDWPNEYYMDMTKTPWREFLIQRAKELEKRGFDGWWCDNLDVYEYYKSSKMYAACKAVLKQIRAIGGYVMVNGGSAWLDDALDKKVKISEIINGYTQEEVFSRIISYKGKGTFSTQIAGDSKFYQSLLKRVLKAKVQTFLLEYTTVERVKKKIKDFCTKNKMTGYYISGDVNL